MKLSLQDRPVRNPDILFKLIEDEAVLVDQDEAVVWRLNETGALLWDALDGRRTAAQAAELIRERFEVAAQIAEEDTLDFLRALAAKDLVKSHALR
ncbi:MAG: PqqD family protein [Elusimicrobia bacterium]|nr:PqqD family protein [Elusimicrobiota bacterium]